MKHILFIITLILTSITFYILALSYQHTEPQNKYEPFLYKQVNNIEILKSIELKPEPKLQVISFVASIFTENEYSYVYAQLHLESNGAKSRRAEKDNNYGGIKCYTRNSEGALFKNDIEFLFGNESHEGYISMMNRLYHRTKGSMSIREYAKNLYFYNNNGIKKTYAIPFDKYVTNLTERYKILRRLDK